MPAIHIIAKGDGCWPDLIELHDKGKLWQTTEPVHLALLEGGMQSGKPSVTIRLDLPNGNVALVETSLAALTSAVATLGLIVSGALDPAQADHSEQATEPNT